MSSRGDADKSPVVETVELIFFTTTVPRLVPMFLPHLSFHTFGRQEVRGRPILYVTHLVPTTTRQRADLEFRRRGRLCGTRSIWF